MSAKYRIERARNHPFATYGFAVASTLAVVLLRLALQGVFGDKSRFLFILIPIMLSSLYGGAGPGATAAFLGIFLSVILNSSTFNFDQPSEVLSVALFAITTAGIVFLASREQAQKLRRLEAEANLEAANARLEERVRERTAELEAANKELQNFCYSVSHDLRTPMRGIAGFAQVLVEDHGDQLNDDAKDLVARMRKASVRLGDLVDALLTYARLGQLEPHRKELDLITLIGQTARVVEKEHGVKIEITVPEKLFTRADDAAMRILLRALLDNAVKYAKPGAPIRVTFGGTREGALFIRDEGIGLDMRYAEKIFVPFERLHRESDIPGPGIGLAVAQRIVERHGGRIWVESALGEGATFYFTLAGKASPKAK